jgi:hypothetical protein
MAEFDLIPESYRQRLRLRRWSRIFALGYTSLIVIVVGAKVLLAHNITVEAAAIDKLKVDKAAVLAHKTHLDALRTERTQLDERLTVLTKLRRGPPAEDIFITIDRALGESIWFMDWKFLHAGEFVDVKPRAVNTGYFVVVPEGEPREEGRAWRVQAHMEIRGQAVDHSALASFVERLSDEPVIRDVKVLKTGTSRYQSTQVVDFELAVILSNDTTEA